MKFFIIVCLFSIQINEYLAQTEQLTVYENESNDNGYKFRYETQNTGRSETASFDSTKPDDVLLKVTGSYFYYGTDGRLYRIEYTADENGYHPKIIIGTAPTFPREPFQAPAALLASLGGQGLG